MPDVALATAADYADAMLTARKAKSVLVLLALLLLLIQLTLFFLVRFDVVHLTAPAALDLPTTQPAARNWADMFQYIITLSTMLGVVVTIVLGFVLLLIVNIMLVGRLIGVARLTSAYIWCLLLLVLLFPWQAFWGMSDLAAIGSMKLPGVLYTWQELIHPTLGAKFASDPLPAAVLHWARFVGFPVLAVVITLAIQIKSNKGIRQALGEDVTMPLPDGTI